MWWMEPFTPRRGVSPGWKGDPVGFSWLVWPSVLRIRVLRTDGDDGTEDIRSANMRRVCPGSDENAKLASFVRLCFGSWQLELEDGMELHGSWYSSRLNERVLKVRIWQGWRMC